MSTICYKRIYSRDITSVAESFKSWDTCMDNKVCKIIAIVGIVLAVIVGIWIVGSLLRCFKDGATGITEFFCWCCGSGRKRAAQDQSMRTQQTGNPPMVVYQPIQQPQNAYYPDESYYDERYNGKVKEIEQDFDLEAQRNKSLKRGVDRTPLVYDEEEEHELNTYHPTLSTYQPQDIQQPNVQNNNRFSPAPPYQPSQVPYPHDDASTNWGYQYHHGNY
ncbi:LAFE_0F06634g1_1 [Lachancea fermentati]|uniref:LAFE_0F06634g1_1 n=1 Tax=Lachancea fermentati TaxID=4955 RepID=A0A1G4MF05_LACFM|nr:LAFE_0F06634g1_1 [Lachancea fermentati]